MREMDKKRRRAVEEIKIYPATSSSPLPPPPQPPHPCHRTAARAAAAPSPAAPTPIAPCTVAQNGRRQVHSGIEGFVRRRSKVARPHISGGDRILGRLEAIVVPSISSSTSRNTCACTRKRSLVSRFSNAAR